MLAGTAEAYVNCPGYIPQTSGVSSTISIPIPLVSSTSRLILSTTRFTPYPRTCGSSSQDHQRK